MAQAKEFLVKVVGAAAVLRSASGSDVYLYRGATVASREFDEDSVKHGLKVKLLEKVAVSPTAAEVAAAKADADAKAKADAAEKVKADEEAKVKAAAAKAKADADAAKSAGK